MVGSVPPGLLSEVACYLLLAVLQKRGDKRKGRDRGRRGGGREAAGVAARSLLFPSLELLAVDVAAGGGFAWLLAGGAGC